MNEDKDAQFLCKDCARYNLCEYYHKRKKDSYICKYFHLTETYGMTNGEVMKAVFPNADHEIWWYIENLKFVGWWDKPYKAESEGKE